MRTSFTLLALAAIGSIAAMPSGQLDARALRRPNPFITPGIQITGAGFNHTNNRTRPGHFGNTTRSADGSDANGTNYYGSNNGTGTPLTYSDGGATAQNGGTSTSGDVIGSNSSA